MKTVQDVLVFTTVGNKLEIKGENTSGIFFQESLNFTTDFYYRHYNQEEPIPYEEIEKELNAANKRLSDVEEAELEPSLGNGGLGRLASCFIDSISSLGINGDGVGLNYHCGLFRQVFVKMNNMLNQTSGLKTLHG